MLAHSCGISEAEVKGRLPHGRTAACLSQRQVILRHKVQQGRTAMPLRHYISIPEAKKMMYQVKLAEFMMAAKPELLVKKARHGQASSSRPWVYC
jgi:hypothetical protein